MELAFFFVLIIAIAEMIIGFRLMDVIDILKSEVIELRRQLLNR